MTTEEFEKKADILARRGIISKQILTLLVNTFDEDESRREKMADCLVKINSLNDEAEDFFILLNQLINEMLN